MPRRMTWGRPVMPTAGHAKDKTATQSHRFDVHQHITDQIVAAIERGAGEFRLPWRRSAANAMRPVNVASKAAYRGVNVLSLWASADANGYESGVWGTFRQWAAAGASVKKGERASYVVFYREITRASNDDPDEAPETCLLARASPVFAAEQVDGYAPPAAIPCSSIMKKNVGVDAFIAATGASIIHGGCRAYYHSVTDSIYLPLREFFSGTATSSAVEAYYATVLHELTHWTGCERRCNRQLGKRFGDGAYAMEELVAELGAAFLCGDLGVTDSPRLDHAQYLDSWLRILKADKRAIFTAASKASQAVEFLSGLHAT